MKLSLSWLLDHLPVTVQEIDAQELLKRFNATTAEIDAFEEIRTDLASLFIVRIDTIESECEGTILESGKKVRLPLRKEVGKNEYYLIKKEDSHFRWAALTDVGSAKEGLFPAVYVTEQEARGPWRNSVEQNDTIITIDNKAITNRPDLWGHRGCAREVAALLGKKLLDEDRFFASKAITHFAKEAPRKEGSSFELRINEQSESCGLPCRRFAGLVINSIEYRASLLKMAFRLARVDSRPLNALVDLTNYVMFDIGQPMHSFDAAKLGTKILEARCAKPGETILLLDGDELTLDGSECVITDGKQPVALAGIMGGEATSVQKETSSLFLESANFDPTSIRLASTRAKKRTESSARFEKSLDPHQNTLALLRYLQLLDEANIPYEAEDAIVSLGPLSKEKTIKISHERIQTMIGTAITSDRVQSILRSLEFGVEKNDSDYIVTVPTFRATKDISIPEDLVEEVARFVGYSSIVPSLPERKMVAFDTTSIERKRRLKHILAYGLSMHEVQTYAVYEENFLKELQLDPSDALRIANPLSEHWQRLITSLVPNLIKCVVTNETEQTLRFFEIDRVWFIEKKQVESQECAGIWYERKKKIDFYEGKALVEKMLDALSISVQWLKPEEPQPVWYDVNQSAQLWHGERVIGRAGKASTRFLTQVVEGEAFIFEIDANFLLQAIPNNTTFVPLPKYPSSEHDITVLVPLSVTVAGIESMIIKADNRIKSVILVDSFEKPEWTDKKSLSFRVTAASLEGTLDKEEIHTIIQRVEHAVKLLGAEIR